MASSHIRIPDELEAREQMFLRQQQQGPRLQGPHVIFHAMCPINLREDL